MSPRQHTWDAWLIGAAMLAIICAVVSPFVMPFFGYGVPYKAAGARGPLFEASDVFIVLGLFFSARCIGLGASKLIGRWIDRAGRPLRAWMRLVVEIAGYVVVLLLGYSLQMKQVYIEPVTIGCAIMVMHMVREALRGEGDRPLG